MHKSATKCNEALSKWCKNKHGASKIIDTLETYQRVMQIRTALSKVKKHDYPNATAYFNRVKSLSNVLTAIGQPLRTKEFKSFLVASLDHNYDALADHVTARPVSDPMPTRNVYASLLNTEQRVKARRTDLGVDMQATANYIARASGGRAPSPTWQPPHTPPGAPSAPGASHPQGSGAACGTVDVNHRPVGNPKRKV
jgi:hypothetical protein